MARPLPTHPKHPERICWGCDKLCSKNELACGNGSERTPHPVELFGDDWLEWELACECVQYSTTSVSNHSNDTK